MKILTRLWRRTTMLFWPLGFILSIVLSAIAVLILILLAVLLTNVWAFDLSTGEDLGGLPWDPAYLTAAEMNRNLGTKITNFGAEPPAIFRYLQDIENPKDSQSMQDDYDWILKPWKDPYFPGQNEKGER